MMKQQREAKKIIRDLLSLRAHDIFPSEMEKQEEAKRILTHLLSYEGEWKILKHLTTETDACLSFTENAVMIQCDLKNIDNTNTRVSCIILKETNE